MTAPAAPEASSEAVRHSMQGNKRANTKPELIVRQRLREAGLSGYRLQWKVPGRPDIAYPGRKLAIFVNGCFWHRCPNCHPSSPKTHTEYWEAKFRRNVERDAENARKLEDMGWSVLTVWECELKRDKLDATMERVAAEVNAAGERAAREREAAHERWLARKAAGQAARQAARQTATSNQEG